MTWQTDPGSQGLAIKHDSNEVLVQVPIALIEGRVRYIFWPPSRVGRVTSHVPAGRLLVKNDDALTDSSHFGAF